MTDLQVLGLAVLALLVLGLVVFLYWKAGNVK